MRSPLLAGIVSVPQVTIASVGPEQRRYELSNTNQLLGQPGVDGIKTGTTAGAGACLVAAANLADGRSVVVVVLGSDPDPADQAGDPIDWPRFADARAILDQIESGR
jgi:D-alanyl-D-alanine carboxypeptidase (penicillin-binding protein 5/6)